MMDRIFQTEDSWAPTIARLVLGSVIFAHGAQKLFGWFGGPGYEGSMQFLTGGAGLPWIIALLVVIIESIGSISIILGFATRIFAGLQIILAIGIITTSHIQNGFFMNWMAAQQGEGYEFHILWIGLALALVISGAGNLSIDKKISE